MKLSRNCVTHIIFLVFMIHVRMRNAIPIASIEVAVKFLSQCGFLPSGIDVQHESVDNISEKIMSRAISEFQFCVGLNVTGSFDEETSYFISKSKCPELNKDNIFASSRSKRYTLSGSKWDKKKLTYNVANHPPYLKKSEVEAEIARAFAVWAKHTDFTFTRIQSGKADIKITFEPRDHGDGYEFDGKGTVLAHTFYPPDGSVHFDDAEKWTVGGMEEPDGESLFQTAVHEFGHVLGLDHTGQKLALMYNKAPKRSVEISELHPDDIQGIQELYGRPPSKSSNFCSNLTIDTILKIDDNSTYIFQGDHYWILTANGTVTENPELINEKWRGLPGNIDAAFQYKDGKTYFFKDSLYWKYEGLKLIGNGPKNISVFKIGNDIDAAMTTSEGYVYFFKGSNYWEVKPGKFLLGRRNEKNISNWKGLTNNIDATFTYNGYTHFFKGDAHYLFPENEFSPVIAIPAYPRSIAHSFFHC